VTARGARAWTRGLGPFTLAQRRGHLDPTRLSILAGALEEAGCAILGHLRGPGPHVRGCRALDTVPGKQ
jgi:hypothetical protein